MKLLLSKSSVFSKDFHAGSTHPGKPRYKNSSAVFLLHAGLYRVVVKKMCSIFPVIFTQYSRPSGFVVEQKKFFWDLLCTKS